ncbi:MAG: hypothetical protein GWN00_22015 [Aliifodinibius sp.]|nr:hypothetical protein [candidate division Zixibacteria bacterium]NIT58797.1 hypothetical protein [Fodinibius sp.]NIS45733.1 hypothetical protein [candidate division Zixibacteria bacterium]NIU13851.1 hypothetical protein [candidate division Zixibacteria bacterium]NIV05905.1 hypothetical protein [candidate division Zixibacteria bacterium]
MPLKVRLAKNAVDSSNPFLYHKTTHRQVYDSALREFPDYDDVILWNEKGEITESCIANVVVFIDGQFATPPISCGLLNGVYRAYLLERNEIKERKIYREEIEKVEDVYLINSVRKWQKVELAKFAKKL